MNVTIVSVEGLRLVLSVEIDLGQYIPDARLQTNLTLLMRKLIGRIEANANSSNPAASRMLGDTEPEGYPVEPTSHKGDGTPADPTKLNEKQRIALESALGRNLTFIWGPPGTGKTHTIGTITKHLYDADRTVLIVSHTNNAVDQAIKFVAGTLKKELEDGVVIRIGEISDDSLSSTYPDVQLKVQVARRSKQLFEKRESLLQEQQTVADDLVITEKKIAITEWIYEISPTIVSLKSDIQNIAILERDLQTKSDELLVLENKHSAMIELHKRTANILSFKKNITEKEQYLRELRSKRGQVESQITELSRLIEEQDRKLKILDRITPLRKEVTNLPKPQEQKATMKTLSSRLHEAESSLTDAKILHTKASEILQKAQAAGRLKRVLTGLPNPNAQMVRVTDLSHKVNSLEAEKLIAESSFIEAEKKLSRILELDSELSRYKTIGSTSEESHRKTQLQNKIIPIKEHHQRVTEELSNLSDETKTLMDELEKLSVGVEGDAKEVYIKVCGDLKYVKDLRDSLLLLRTELNSTTNDITKRLSSIQKQIQEWATYVDPKNTLEDQLTVISSAHRHLLASHPYTGLKTHEGVANSLRQALKRISEKIEQIDILLAEVRQEVIANASIIGATLTKTYLSDDIQERKFDTVILDEASMAPIPALWVAALLAESNLILVGDFKQLSPIVLSNKESTKEWLGQDIFDKSGVKQLYEDKNEPRHCVTLVEQRRMLPEISAVANLFYNGIIKDYPPDQRAFESFRDWYSFDSEKDNPVVLVDTGSLNAWVTSVVKGGRSSRLNFLSATVAVDLAEQLLTEVEETHSGTINPKILIISPYRPHTTLVNILLSENGLLKENVSSGTVHSFQGSEAPVVIFDFVVDEPHFRANLFFPTIDDQIKRLLNVALTRAKFRLFILCDFDYCQKLGKKAFLGNKLLPDLLRLFPRIDAKDLVPEGIAARAAQAQMTMLGGEIEPTANRLVVTHHDFFRLLSNDLSKAEFRIVIFSPFLTQDRVGFILPQLHAAKERNVDIYIITKAHSDRNKSELQTIHRIEYQLSEIGVIIMHKLRMHEKLVFIDDSVVWSGSLNPLSYSNTQEVMERRFSTSVMKDYLQVLRVEKLLSIPDTPESFCPICGEEIIASEGKNEPYFWRCVNDNCYTRSIDQPYPYDGLLTCARCGSPVEFGYWGGKASWRCTANKHHHQRLYKSHLRLPRMAALIPTQDRKKLVELLGIDKFDFPTGQSESILRTDTSQMNLFSG